MRRIFHTFKLICFLTILSLSFHDINAKAFEDRSVIFLCYENVDGKNSDSCSLNNKIYKYLQGQGAFVVDPNQAAQVRNHLSPEKLSSKGGLKGANLMDAEFVVLLKIKASKQVIPGKTMAFQSYLVKYDLSVINVSRANIILNYEAKMTGLGLNADSAIESAAQKFWKKENISLAKTFDTAFEDLSGADLWVFDLKDFKAVRKLDKHLKSLKTVSKVKRVHFGKGLAKWRIKIKGENSPDSLADSLENEKSLFLETQGINGNLIQLAYNPKAKIKMAILIEAKSNKKMPKWFSESQTQTIQNQLLTFGYIKPINDKNQNHILKLKVEAKKSKKKQYLLKYSLQSASGKTLSGLSKIGQEGNLANLQKEALNEIFNNFHSYLKKNPQEFASLSGLLDSPKTFYAKLAFNNKDGSIFGAQLERYRKEGLGFAQSEGKFDELKIRTKISGYGEFSPWLEAKEGKLPIIPNFESSLSSIRKPTTLRIVAEIQATKGERLYRKTLSSTGLYYPNNAINWNNLDSFSAFIDPSAPWAKKLIGTALNSRIEKFTNGTLI